MKKHPAKQWPIKLHQEDHGDIATCYADPKKAEEELGWRAEKTLDDMCKDSWHYIDNQHRKNHD